MHHIKGNPMIIGNILGSDKGDGDNFAIRHTSTHVGLVIKIDHDRIDEDKRCGHPNDVNEHSCADVELSIHIVAKFFMDVNEQSWLVQ